jgi:Electron transfer DM13
MRFTRSLCTLALGVVAACSNAEPPTATNATPVTPDGPLSGGLGVTASFMRTGYNVTGTATLVIDKGVAQLDFSPDFSIASTPGPFVYLNTDANPNRGQPLRVAALRARTGAQRYTFQVPAGVRYSHVIIWCDPFNVGMAQAVIPPTP